jgi:hypothetical protein
MSKELPAGLSAFKPRQLDLKAVNDSGNKAYTGSQDNRILFHLGAYPATFLNNERSFLHFKPRISAGGGDDKTAGMRFKDGVPIFERVIVRSGGVLLADVRDYQELDILLQNFMDVDHLRKIAPQVGNYKGVLVEGDADTKLRAISSFTGAQIDTVGKFRYFGKPLRKQLHGCGIFDPKSFLPIGLLGSQTGAPAIEIELFLAPADKVLERRNGTALSEPASAEYELCEVRYSLELTSVPQDMYAELNSRLMSGGSYSLDFPMYRSYRNYLSGGDNYDVTIHNSVRNLEEVMVVLKEQGGAYPHRFLGGGARRVGDTIVGGVNDFKVASHQFKFGADIFPSDGRVENSSTDARASLFHALRGKDMLYSEKQPWASQVNPIGRSSWEELGGFVICQSFKSTSGSAKNGIATASVGVPLILDLRFDVDTTETAPGTRDFPGKKEANSIEAIAYTKESYKLVISGQGDIQVVEA